MGVHMAATPLNAGFDASVPLGPYVGGLKAAGVPFVGRYIASKPDAQWKVITPSEAVELAIAGVPLFPIYENVANQSGSPTGKADGTYAASYLPTIGLMPDTGVIIYYTEDFNVQTADMSGICAAFEAFGAALSGYGVGVYSCGYCNAQLAQKGLVTKKWLSGSTSYNGTRAAIEAGDYDIWQGVPKDVTINNRVINVDLDSVQGSNADIGARVPWDGAIPQNAPLTVVSIQMLLNKAGQTPPLDADDVSGTLTKAAIIASKQKYSLPATTSVDWTNWVPRLCRDAGVKIVAPAPNASSVATTAPMPDSIMQRVVRLENTVGVSGANGAEFALAPSAMTASTPADPITSLERVASIVKQMQAGASDQPLSVMKTGNEPPLGQVNGALGQTIGNLMNGKKTAIGITGAMLTSILSQVPASTGLGQVLALLTPSSGLSPYLMPIFLAVAAWGVLGKMEKWSQGDAPSLQE